VSDHVCRQIQGFASPIVSSTGFRESHIDD
jgi:hypothetical protein